jgi:hypothetical protein
MPKVYAGQGRGSQRSGLLFRTLPTSALTGHAIVINSHILANALWNHVVKGHCEPVFKSCGGA